MYPFIRLLVGSVSLHENKLHEVGSSLSLLFADPSMALSRYSVNSCWMNEWALKSGEGWDVDINNYWRLLIIFFSFADWICHLADNLRWSQNSSDLRQWLTFGASSQRQKVATGSLHSEFFLLRACPQNAVCLGSSPWLSSYLSSPGPSQEPTLSQSWNMLLSVDIPWTWSPALTSRVRWKAASLIFYSNELYTEPVQSQNTRPFTETLLWISRQGHQSIKRRVEPLWAQGNSPGHTPRKPALTTDVSNLASARSSPSSSSHLHRLLLPGSSSPSPPSHSSRAQPFTPPHHPSLLNLLSRGLCLSLCLSFLSTTSPTQAKSILQQPPNHTLPPISPLFKPFYRSLQTDLLKVQNFNIKSRLFIMKIRPS